MRFSIKVANVEKKQSPYFLNKHFAVFILRPTNVRIWHKAVFKVGPVADTNILRKRKGVTIKE